MKNINKNGDFENNQFTERIRIKPKKLLWIKNNKRKIQSAAAFLDEILDDFIKPNLFKKKK